MKRTPTDYSSAVQTYSVCIPKCASCTAESVRQTGRTSKIYYTLVAVSPVSLTGHRADSKSNGDLEGRLRLR